MTTETERREAFALADAARVADADEPGLVCCRCGTTWCKLTRLRGLADLDCPRCGALYADVARNVEP